MSRLQSSRGAGRMLRTVLVALGAAVALVVAAAGTGAQAPAAGAPAVQPAAGAQAPAAGAARQGGPGGGAFAGQTPINALIVSGGCCHDYGGQNKIIMDTLNAVMPINWTTVLGMASLPDGKLPLYERPNWTAGYDIVIHNECWANGNLPAQVVKNITQPSAGSVPRMFFHCSLHSYRIMTDDSWREIIGITSRRHTRAHNIAVKWVDGDPITDGLPPFVTPIDELYVVEKQWPGVKSIATAVSPEEGTPTFPVVWTQEYRGARVFGTSLGHANETFTTNQFKELVTRGFRWALKKDPIALPPPAQPARGGGAAAPAGGARGAAGAPGGGAPAGRGGN